MRSERGSQRDLFKMPPPRPELRSDVRIKLGPLLRALLTEAAGQAPRSTVKDLSKTSEEEWGGAPAGASAGPVPCPAVVSGSGGERIAGDRSRVCLTFRAAEITRSPQERSVPRIRTTGPRDHAEFVCMRIDIGNQTAD
ncbi:hypothetical protein SAMN05444161_6773 [Rhizobiales bacterium GAS191]|nr:hypothetical protein SAMN05519103_05867 [Rhizobiales bacterium GAS113]SEE70257.1 hypothetical protein SAMN05444161_6773 [Rhizobiales bacterium GAS191]